MRSIFNFALAAFFEITGCFAFWSVVRLGKSAGWLAGVLTRVETAAAGRAYATYGGVYIIGSLLWLWLIEDRVPDRWDVGGGTICLVGAAILFFRPRT